MAIFNFKSRQASTTLPASTEGSEPYQGDLGKTGLLRDLFECSKAERDQTWQDQVLEHMATASFACANPPVIQGPDGFPYLSLQTPEANKPFQCYVIHRVIPDFIMERGIGIVINAQKAQPDWVFSYGDLVNYTLNGRFYEPVMGAPLPEKEQIQKDESVLTGQPSETYLPASTRSVLRKFIEQQGIQDPKIVLMSRKYDTEVRQELVCNLTPEKVGTALFETLHKYIGWFLPRHYSLVAMQENGSLKRDFKAL